MLGRLAGNLLGTAGGTALGGKAGSAIGTTIGLAAGGPVGALIGAPLGAAIGGFTGGAIGGDVGKEVLGKKRMAGQMDPRLLMMNINMSNPNVQGLGLVDPNQGRDLPFAKYLVDPNPQQNPYAMY
tara:strand:- start:239 stop:616 length:378 start_codon:yes stop_codon:yes gene_type:complete